MLDFPETVQLERRTGLSSRGDPEFAAAVVLNVRWEDGHRLVKNQQGETTPSSARVFCAAEVKPGDVLTRAAQRYPVISGGGIQDPFGGSSHWEVYV